MRGASRWLAAPAEAGGAQELEEDHEHRERVNGVAMRDALHKDLLP